MDRLLHRGKYAVESDVKTEPSTPRVKLWRIARFIGMDDQYTRGDKWIAGGIFCWTTFWKIVAVVILVWNLFFWRWTDAWWFNYQWATSICMPLAIGVLTTTWFTIGGTRDLLQLFKALRAVKSDASDDGTVRHDHNAGGPDAPKEATTKG